MPLEYTNEVRIALPRDKVIALFDDPGNMKHWQPGLLSFEPVSGEPVRLGARSRLRYRMGGREIEMIETITARDLPEVFSGTYEAKGVVNHVENRFAEDGPDATLWTTRNTFHCTGIMRLFTWLMPGSFKKQTQVYLEHFKAFAETGASVADDGA